MEEERSEFGDLLKQKGKCCICEALLSESEHTNMVMLNKIAEWEFPSWGNILAPKREGQPFKFALAVACDNCVDPETGKVIGGDVRFAIEIAKIEGEQYLYYHDATKLRDGQPEMPKMPLPPPVFDEIDLDMVELPFNPKLNETVVEFLQRQRIMSDSDSDLKYECRRCGDCCKWFYYKLIVPPDLADQLYMRAKSPHGYWVLTDKLQCYMPVGPGEPGAQIFHFEGNLPQGHVDYCVTAGRRWGYWVLDEKDKAIIYSPVECIHLENGNFCNIYKHRPDICRAYQCGRYPVE
jgi:Fe-S-cluster containining protein